MKCESMSVCPGCKKHCPMGAPRCKYGRNYFEKTACAQEKAMHREKKEKKRGWEENVTQGSAVYQLISAGRSAKKALKKGEMTEEQLLSSLSEVEQKMLSDLLEMFRHKNFGAAGV